MNRLFSVCSALLGAALIVLPGCASNDKAKPADKPTSTAQERHSSTSEVVAIDAATRRITLREPGEEAQAYLVDKAVRNLDQVKVGDHVNVDYFETVTIKVLPPGPLGDDYSSSLDRSQPGQKPGGMVTQSFSRTAEVASVFPKTSEVVTRNAAGTLRTWYVQDTQKLETIHPGDRVQLTYTESLAIKVTPAPKPATP